MAKKRNVSKLVEPVINRSDVMADLINYDLCHGKSIVKAENIWDTGQKEIYNITREDAWQGPHSKAKPLEKIRDILKIVKYTDSQGNQRYFYYGVEVMSYYDPSIILRTQMYSTITYDRQANDFHLLHQNNGDLNNQKIMVRMLPGDLLSDVYTSVFYFGEVPWGHVKISLDPCPEFSRPPDLVKGSIIDPHVFTAEDIARFHSKELIILSKVIQNLKKDDSDTLIHILMSDPDFENVDYQLASAIRGLIGYRFKLKGRRNVNVCTAIQSFIDTAKKRIEDAEKARQLAEEEKRILKEENISLNAELIAMKSQLLNVDFEQYSVEYCQQKNISEENRLKILMYIRTHFLH